MALVVLTSGSKFIGCPIVFSVTPGSVPAGATFHRVRVVVTINGIKFEFSAPVDGSGAIPIDISSAFRAVADKYEYSATTLSYPSFGNVAGDKIEAFDDFLVDGVETHSTGTTGTLAAPYHIGRLTDRERLFNASVETYYGLSNYTRKPKTSPEVCFVGYPYILAGSISSAPSASLQPVSNGMKVAAGMQTIGGYQVYGINKPTDGYELRFINSLGVHESLHITCLRQTEVNIKNDFYTIARLETLNEFSRGVSVKQNDYEQWRMSSGPLDRAWQQ